MEIKSGKGKRVIAYVLVLTMIMSMLTGISAKANADNSLYVTDVLLTLQIAVGESTATEEQMSKLDKNGDDQITAIDALILLRQCLQLEEEAVTVSYAKIDVTNAAITSNNTSVDSSHPSTTVTKAWDGNVSTFPDYYNDGDWMKIDLGQPYVIGRIDIYPREDYTTRMLEGVFEGSTDGEEWTELHMVDRIPVEGQYNSIIIYESEEYSQIRYTNPAGGSMNVCEVVLYTLEQVSTGALWATIKEAKTLNDDTLQQAIQTAEDALMASDLERIKAYQDLKQKVTQCAGKYSDFAPSSIWRDTDGVPIQAHGGGVMWDPVSEMYYWYGEHKGTDNYVHADGSVAGTPVIGTAVYSSKDLYNWTNEGIALPVFNNPELFGEATDATDDTPMYLDDASEEFRLAEEKASSQGEYESYTSYYTFHEYNKHDLDKLNAPYKNMTREEKIRLYNEFNWNMVMERPKVVYNPNTQKYVMWFHYDGPTVGKYSVSKGGVAISESPVGPFQYLGTPDLSKGKEDIISANGENATDTAMLRDMTFFVDDDGTGYLLYANESNDTLYIEELDETYTDTTGNFSRNFVRDDTVNYYGVDAREAPAIMKYNGKYYIITSGCTGWAANAAGVAIADQLIIDYDDNDTSEEAKQHIGPFQHIENSTLPNPCISKSKIFYYRNNCGYSNTFGGQSTYIIPVQGKEGCFVYMGDHWNASQLENSRYQWLPIVLNEDGTDLSVVWADRWSLDDFDKIAENRAELNTLIKTTRSMDSSVLSSDDITAFKLLIDEASSLNLGATKEQVQDYIDQLLVFYNQMALGDIDNAIKKVDTLSKAEYTDDSWAKVESASEEARKLDANASAEEIDAAVKAIEDAIDGLVEAELNLTLISQSTLSVQANSQQNSANQASNTIDGNINTIWHSNWNSGHPVCSSASDNLYITITLPDDQTEKGLYQLKYLPRQKDYNGIITGYSIKVSDGTSEFTEVENGYWDGDATEKTVTFKTTETVKQIRLVAQKSAGNKESDINQFASAAEINILAGNN